MNTDTKQAVYNVYTSDYKLKQSMEYSVINFPIQM